MNKVEKLRDVIDRLEVVPAWMDQLVKEVGLDADVEVICEAPEPCIFVPGYVPETRSTR